VRQQLNLDISFVVQPGENLSEEFQTGSRWFKVTTSPVINQDGDLRGSTLVLDEITDKKKSDEALRLSEKLASTGRLAHSIAHEINNPLAALTNLLYLANLSAAESPETLILLATAQKELERVARITRQTLSFHRDTKTPVDSSVAEVLQDVAGLIGPQVERKGVNLVLRTDASRTIPAFPGELRQVFANFVSNALEATPEGGTIILHGYDSREWTANGRRGVRISVVDNGTGIPKEIREKIFEAFFTTKELRGSGLGLWLTRNVVAKHHGSIRVRSTTRPGRSGTCFSIFLPASETPAVQQEGRTHVA
jgi:signal transduction histidine kinase